MENSNKDMSVFEYCLTFALAIAIVSVAASIQEIIKDNKDIQRKELK